MKKENRNISQFIILGLAAIPAFFDENEYFKTFNSFVDQYAVYYPTLVIILMIWSMLSSLKESKEKSIRIATKNDSYYNILPYIFGSMIIVTSLILIYYSVFDLIILIQVMIIGVLLIISGILFKPRSYVKMKRKKLIFLINNQKQWISIDKVKDIKIQSDKIIVLEKGDKINNIDSIDLNMSDIENLKRYLNTNIGIDI